MYLHMQIDEPTSSSRRTIRNCRSLKRDRWSLRNAETRLPTPFVSSWRRFSVSQSSRYSLFTDHQILIQVHNCACSYNFSEDTNLATSYYSPEFCQPQFSIMGASCCASTPAGQDRDSTKDVERAANALEGVTKNESSRAANEKCVDRTKMDSGSAKGCCEGESKDTSGCTKSNGTCAEKQPILPEVTDCKQETASNMANNDTDGCCGNGESCDGVSTYYRADLHADQAEEQCIQIAAAAECQVACKKPGTSTHFLTTKTSSLICDKRNQIRLLAVLRRTIQAQQKLRKQPRTTPPLLMRRTTMPTIMVTLSRTSISHAAHTFRLRLISMLLISSRLAASVAARSLRRLINVVDRPNHCCLRIAATTLLHPRVFTSTRLQAI